MQTVKAVIGAVLVFASATSALAVGGYYLVRDPTTMTCTVVDKKPTATTYKVVGDPLGYDTRAKAEEAMSTWVRACTSD
jgi:hypothetical protein